MTYTDKSDGNTRHIYEWILTASENGTPIRITEYPDKSYAMWGTFGGTVTLQGSWDPVTSPTAIDANSWFTLTESDNTTAITGTGGKAGVILENPVWMRPIAGTDVSLIKFVITASPRGRY